MAYDGLVTELPAGLAGMVNHDNRLLTQRQELLEAEGVVFEDNLIRREPGAVLYDGTGGFVNRPAFPGDIAASDAGHSFKALMVTYKALAGAAHVKNLDTNEDSQTFVTSIALVLTVPAGGVPINNRVIVTAAVSDDFAPTTVITVTDTRGNTYTRDAERGGSGRTEIHSSSLTTALFAADSITVTYTNLTSNAIPTNVAAVAEEFTLIFTTAAQDQTASTATKLNDTGATYSFRAGPVGVLAQVVEVLYGGVGVLIDDVDGTPTIISSGGWQQLQNERSTALSSSSDVAIQSAFRLVVTGGTAIALTAWRSQDNPASLGTVTAVSTSAVLLGSGTTFTDYAPGDFIVVQGERRRILSITNNTTMLMDEIWRQDVTARTYAAETGVRIFTATTEGAILRDKPLTLTTGDLDESAPGGGLSLAQETGWFVPAGLEAAANKRKLFYLNGLDPVQVLAGDGAAFTDIATPPLDWGTATDPTKQPQAGIIHRNQLAVFGSLADPHRVYFSDVDNHEDFTGGTSFSMRFRSDIGDIVQAAVSFNGVLFIFKHPVGIYWLDDTPISTTNWVINTKSSAVGVAPSPYAALAIDDDVLFMAEDGSFHFLSAVDLLGGVKNADATYALGLSRWIRDNVNLSRLDLIQSVWYTHKKTAYFAVPSTGSNQRDLILKWDFGGTLRGLPARFSFSRRDEWDGSTMRQSLDGDIPRPIFAEGNLVFLSDQDARNKDGAAYTTTYDTPDLDFSWVDDSLRNRRKLFEHIELVMTPVVGTITVEYFVDGTSKGTQTFDANTRRVKRRLTIGDGYTLRLRVTNSVLNDDFKILSHIIFFKPGNENQNR